jgi:PAS domain S-box-containing protein
LIPPAKPADDDGRRGVFLVLARNPLWLLWLMPLYVVYQYVRMHALRLRLSKREEMFRLIGENAADMIAVVDVNGRRLYNSPAYERILGYSSKELMATSSLQQVHPDDRQKVMEAATAARRTGVGKRLEYRSQHKNGAWLILESSASAVRNAKGDVEKLVIVTRDISERKRAEEQLKHNALHDALTDLPNRILFLNRLNSAFERAQRDPGYEFAVLFVDIDGFKAINDTMGHSAGDDLISEISHRLSHCLRYADTLARPLAQGGSGAHAGDEVLARFGGDEFTILVTSIRHPSDAMRVAKRIQRVLGTFTVRGREVFISASVGIALSTIPHTNPEELLRDADLAMYRARTLGKSRCEFFDQEMHTHAVKQLDLETDLRRAVDEQEFRLHYQPIIQLKEGHITGFEALVRWQRKECLVFPDSFIGTAEGMGLVVSLGKWILRQACRQAQSWHLRYPQDPALSVTVNVSPKQFADAHLTRDIKEVLAETGVDPCRLHLEITESVAMADPARTAEVLCQLKGAGVRICLDDFGTGHSSLSRLRHFPMDILKIDRSFVTHIDTDPSALEIVRLIIEFAHTIHLKVIAEGVETAAHLELLSSLGCEFGQGYLFSKPVDPEGVERLLGAGEKSGAPPAQDGQQAATRAA